MFSFARSEMRSRVACTALGSRPHPGCSLSDVSDSGKPWCGAGRPACQFRCGYGEPSELRQRTNIVVVLPVPV